MTVVFVSAMAAACVGEPDVSTSTQGVLEGNRLAVNRLAVNRLALNRLAVNRLAVNKISNNLYQLTANDLISTAEGRELLEYVVTCAIPAEVVLVGTHEGVTYEFPGDIGLARRWLDHDLRESEQRWVSACLLSRVNRFNVEVTISIRGPHKALKVSESEAADYAIEEGAFYGDVFQDAEEPLVWNACRGRNEASSESGDLDLRDCTEPDPANPGFTLCGFTYAGDCADWVKPKNAYACKKFRTPKPHGGDCAGDEVGGPEYRGGYYEDCHDSPGLGKWPGAERFDEVITVFVAP